MKAKAGILRSCLVRQMVFNKPNLTTFQEVLGKTTLERKKKKTQKTKISLFIPAFLRVAADYREHLVNEMVLNSVPKWRALKLKSTQRKNHMN